MQSAESKKILLIIGAVMGWAAVVLQFVLLINNRVASVPETIIRFFSFFTILTNILVALSFTFQLFRPASRWGKFFSQPKTLTAITVYISFVGISYQILLRHIWEPQGLQQIVDEMLHSVIPAFSILYWILFVPKAGLQWKNMLPWLVYPLCYFLYVLLRGVLSGFYPYPFIDVNKLGYTKTFLHSGMMLAAFILLSLLFIWVGKKLNRSWA